MAIHKAREHQNFTVIPNSTAQDKSLSFEARGLLALLLSLPDDWSVNKAWLIEQSEAGRDKVQRLINELCDSGYMTKTQPKNQQGKFTSNDYFVYSRPQEKAVDVKPVNGLTADGETHTTKETVIQKKQDTNINTSSSDDEVESAFNVFWFAGMRKVGKSDALKAFKRVCKNNKRHGDPMQIAQHLKRDVEERLGTDQIGFDRLHPSTYLNGERWNDEYSVKTNPDGTGWAQELYEDERRKNERHSAGNENAPF